nr:hypothetical protein [Tanacetum cinerariifolium]
LTSRVAAASVSPATGVLTAGVPTVSGSFPTVSAIFTIASVRLSEQLAKDSEIARLHAEEELKMMIEGLDRSNEMIAKHLQEYEQAEAELTIREKIELINELEQREFYMSVLRSHAGWKTRHFKGMTLEEIKENFIPVWKQSKDFVPMSSKEEAERVKRKGLKLDQGSSKRMKTSEDVSEEKLKEMMQLVPLEEVYVEAMQVKHPIIAWEIYSEDLHQLWTLVKKTLSIKQATKEKEKELWVELKRLFEPDFKYQLWTYNQAFIHDPLDWKLYDTCGVHHVSTKDQEIFMLFLIHLIYIPMAGEGVQNMITRRVTDDLIVFSGETSPSRYTKFLLEQKIAESRRFVERMHSEVATSRDFIAQLNVVVAEFEAMENQEEVHDSWLASKDARRGEQGRLDGLNEVIDDALEEIEKLETNLLKKKQQVKVLQKKKGRTVVINTEDMQKRRNDVKARTTLLLALPDEHQLRFSKYNTAKELWEAILKTFGGNEATKKTKKNQLKQQYGNFKAEGSETLEQTFNRLQAIVSHLEFMYVEIEQNDLNQKLLTILAPEWLMYTIVWRNRDGLDTISLDDVHNHLKVYEPEVQKKSESNSQNMAFISSANTSSGKGEVHTASVLTASTQVSTKHECCTPKGHLFINQHIHMLKGLFKEGQESELNFEFQRECRAPRSQDRGRRESYKQGSKEEEPAPKDLMAINGIGWDWSHMANEEENHARVADDEAPTEFALMAKSSLKSKNKVKKEKEGLDSKLTGFESASKDLDTLLESQRTNKNREGLGYSVVPTPLLLKPSPSKESNTSDLQNTDSPTIIKTNKFETARKSSVKYAEMYRNTSKSPKVRGNQRNWNNLKSQQLGKDFLMKNKAYFKCGHFDHLAYDCGVWVKKGKTLPKNNIAHKNVTPRADLLKTGRTPIAINRTNMNVAQPKRTSFAKTAHSYVKGPFQGKSVVITQFRVPRVSTVTKKFPTVKSTFTVDLGNKGKAVKASACWI